MYRLVKQLVEMPTCHVTTLKLAGNSLQVSITQDLESGN